MKNNYIEQCKGKQEKSIKYSQTMDKMERKEN